ncbi:MAG: hypothetical protein KAT65_02175, partial [Methanophagales archaeon]|nr:hypothetical protein [Methanophagales archaeon]
MPKHKLDEMGDKGNITHPYIHLFSILSFAICFMLVLFAIHVTSVAASSSGWVVGSDGDEWNANIAFDDTTIKYENVELLNGWNPSNVVHIQSGGSSNLLKSPNRKMAMRYAASTSKKVTKIALLPCCYFPEEDQPVWRVGVQADDDGLPSGTYLGSGTFGGGFVEDEKWFFTTISPEVSLIEGTTYWIVIQYDSGPIPNATDHWIGFYASAPELPDDVSSDNIPLPYNYGGQAKNVNDAGNTTVRFYNGASWSGDPNGRTLGTFILAFDDNTYHGQPYKHNYAGIAGNNQFAQIFKIYNHDKTINKLEMPWNVFHADGVLARPNDDLYYYIREGDHNGATIASGTFITKEEVYVSGSGNGAGDRRWYNITIDPPITLEKDKTYFMYFNSPHSNATATWGTDTPNSFENYESGEIATALKETTFDTNTCYFMRTDRSANPWSDNRRYYGRDLSFRFHLVDVYRGYLTSVEKDAVAIGSAGDIWKQIKFEGSVPSGTNVSIDINSPSCGGFGTVQNNAVSGFTYDLPLCAQERYASWRLVLRTDDPSITPEIYDVTLISGV